MIKVAYLVVFVNFINKAFQLTKLRNYLFGLFKIIKAAITPGIQPKHVNIKTIITDPQPLSRTANGGNKIDNNTLQILMMIFFD
jgi:hypothetical protein